VSTVYSNYTPWDNRRIHKISQAGLRKADEQNTIKEEKLAVTSTEDTISQSSEGCFILSN
jgi:hypothetical protein